jgi:DNA-binding CsgD family transcriptional regulator/tetratricopeptide (TPR) repeat protein
LIRASIEEDSPGTYRALEHRRAAELLHAEGATPERVAGQLLAAPGMAEPWAVTLLQQVAARARERGATEAALRYLRRALDEPPRPEDLALVLRDLGSAELAVTEPEAAGHLQRAHEGTRDPGTRAEIARLWARALNDRGDTVAAVGVIEAAIEDAGGHPGLAVGLIADYLTTCVLHPHLRQAAMARSDPLLQSLPEQHRRDGGALDAARAMRAAQSGDPPGSVVEYADAAWQGGLLLDGDGPGGPAARMILWALLLSEQYARADAVATAMLEVAQQRGMLRAFRAASYYRGFCRLRRGRILEAQADVAQALAAGHEGPIGSAAHGAVAALLLIERGELDRAETALAHPAAEEEQWLPGAAYQLVAQGRIAVARGETAVGLARFEQAGTWVHDTLGADRTVVPWRLGAARARLALGEPARARALVEPLGSHPPVTAACARAVLSMTETGRRRTDGLRAALIELDRTDAELEQVRVRVDLGGVLRREGSRADAVELLGETVHRARGVGAELLAARAADELAAAGVRPRRRPASGLAALTPSERRVGRLAADGHTNAEIAQGLFVTPKTVEYHLRHVYQKLGVTGRRELPALFRPDPQDLS